MVAFAGYHMPVIFEGIEEEHERVRSAVGLFDVSHMGEIEITGAAAWEFADFVVSNSVGKLEKGQICYTVACNTGGGVLDDLLVYKFSSERILLVVNAINTEKIFNHVAGLKPKGIEIENLTDEVGQIAVQGPLSLELLRVCDFCSPVHDVLDELRYYRFLTFEYAGREVILSRTGYTGELGFEIYLPGEHALEVWNELLDAGRDKGIRPIGLGARDTLRFEAGYCLYGHELDEETSPLEAGLGWIVKLGKGDFIGRDALVSQKETGPRRKLVGFEVDGRRIARQGSDVLRGGENVGTITSGTLAPTVKKNLAMALVSSATADDGDRFEVVIGGKPYPLSTIKLPFYKSRTND
jgi:aminomethyltransferase